MQKLLIQIHLLTWKSLGADGAGQAYIETVPKSGYRFIGEVEEISEDVIYW